MWRWQPSVEEDLCPDGHHFVFQAEVAVTFWCTEDNLLLVEKTRLRIFSNIRAALKDLVTC